MHHFSDVQLRRVVRTLLERAGSEPAEAAQVADHLVDANLRGHDSHGIGMIPHYVHNITNETMRPNTGLSVVRDGGAVMLFDGGLGYGQRVGVEMMERLIERARELGAVTASLRNVHHLGRIGTYAEMAVAAGLVSIHFVNVTGHPPLVAPYRGSQARFGTNPICIGVPGTSRTSRSSSTWRRASSHWARSGSPSTRASRSPRGRWWMRKASRRPIRR